MVLLREELRVLGVVIGEREKAARNSLPAVSPLFHTNYWTIFLTPFARLRYFFFCLTRGGLFVFLRGRTSGKKAHSTYGCQTFAQKLNPPDNSSSSENKYLPDLSPFVLGNNDYSLTKFLDTMIAQARSRFTYIVRSFRGALRNTSSSVPLDFGEDESLE